MVHYFNVNKELNEAYLQGRPLGRKHFPELCSLVTQIPGGGVILLDFESVQMVTGSWINAALIPLLSWMTDQRNDLFPVILNFSDDWIDELQMVAEWNHSCFLVSKGKKLPKCATLVGKLDSGQRETLNFVSNSTGVSGAELERLRPDAGVKATAWNNRLKDLYEKRLLRREKRGREQIYSSVVPEVTING